MCVTAGPESEVPSCLLMLSCPSSVNWEARCCSIRTLNDIKMIKRLSGKEEEKEE